MSLSTAVGVTTNEVPAHLHRAAAPKKERPLEPMASCCPESIISLGVRLSAKHLPVFWQSLGAAVKRGQRGSTRLAPSTQHGVRDSGVMAPPAPPLPAELFRRLELFFNVIENAVHPHCLPRPPLPPAGEFPGTAAALGPPDALVYDNLSSPPHRRLGARLLPR